MLLHIRPKVNPLNRAIFKNYKKLTLDRLVLACYYTEEHGKYNPERNICSSNGQIVIGTAAAVGLKYKGQQYVIRAMKKLATLGYNDYVYEIAGNGNASSLVRLAEECGLSDRVIFPGSIPHDKIMDWHRHLNIYIQPSLQEGLPRALIEAMSCGTPCIGSKTGGIPELLSKDFIFQTKNPDEIANKLIMLRSPEVFRKNSIECIEKSSEYKKEVLNARRISFMSDVFLK